MKKIAFMFAAAALFVACGNGEQKPAEVVETVVEEVAEVLPTYEIIDDSIVVVTNGEQVDTVVNDSALIATAKAALEAVEAVAEQAEEEVAE